tara:strand:+ start:910 stop:1527 length:618 start_codon:yes stop_codon:yes gene_type:complete
MGKQRTLKPNLDMNHKKRIFYITLISFALLLPQYSEGDESKDNGSFGVLPSQKKQQLMVFILDDKDRNPFVIAKEENKIVEGVSSHSEETKIRSILESLKVNGISRGDNGYKVQLGGLILKPGRLLPRIIEGQSDDLMVKNISPTNIEIMWVGDEEADKPRVMLIPVDLDPKVGVVLPLNAKNDESAGSRLVYIKKKDLSEKNDN